MRDRIGGINEPNRDQLAFFTRQGLFTREQYEKRLFHAIAIVTSNKVEFNQYKQQQLKKEDHE